MGKFIDITGQRYGNLTAIRRIGTNSHNSALWLFKCDCGNDYTASSASVRHDGVTNCGCKPLERYIDITGQKFGRLTAIRFFEKGSKTQRVKWLFRCDCGKEVISDAHNVKQGNKKSCGCLGRESSANTGRQTIKVAIAACTTHGMSNTKLYTMWQNMKERCCKPNRKDSKHYYDKGITVCDEWLNSAKAFIDWALSNGYQEGLSIDRIENDKNYCPDNCRFIPLARQKSNTSQNHFITINGETNTVADWARFYQISAKVIRRRLQLGWSPQDAVLRPVAH